MANSRSKALRTSMLHATQRAPLQNLQRIQPHYFFTPDLEREISKLMGVQAVRVLTTGSEIDEIHVISRTDRVPKKLVRDIESLLLVQFGIRLDHRKIGIVQMDQAPSSTPAISRPRILKVERVSTNDANAVCVQVDVGETVIMGTGVAAEGESALHSSSRAALHAIEQMLKTQGVLELRQVESIPARDHEIVVAVVTWTLGGVEEVLVGASVARGDTVSAAARATLDALNRKLVHAEMSTADTD